MKNNNNYKEEIMKEKYFAEMQEIYDSDKYDINSLEKEISTYKNKIEEINKKIKEIEESSRKKYENKEELETESNIIISSFIKRKKLLSFLDWHWNCSNNIYLKCKTKATFLPEEIISLTRKDYHYNFSLEKTKNYDIILKYYDDDDVIICVECFKTSNCSIYGIKQIVIDEVSVLLDFCKKWDIKINSTKIDEDIKNIEESINKKTKILEHLKRQKSLLS